jgi:hypothetical protein
VWVGKAPLRFASLILVQSGLRQRRFFSRELCHRGLARGGKGSASSAIAQSSRSACPRRPPSAGSVDAGGRGVPLGAASCLGGLAKSAGFVGKGVSNPLPSTIDINAA